MKKKVNLIVFIVFVESILNAASFPPIEEKNEMFELAKPPETIEFFEGKEQQDIEFTLLGDEPEPDPDPGTPIGDVLIPLIPFLLYYGGRRLYKSAKMKNNQ